MVAGDIDAPRRPHAVVRHHVVEEAGEGSGAPRPSDKAAVQADRQHLRLPGTAFAVGQVERILQIAKELLAGVEALRRGKAHRSEEHTSELQSLMPLSYAVF